MDSFRVDLVDGFAIVTPNEQGAELWWTDGIANEWREQFSTVALAVLRLASLFQCAGSNWTCGFSVEPQEFERLGDEFFLQVVTH